MYQGQSILFEETFDTIDWSQIDSNKEKRELNVELGGKNLVKYVYDWGTVWEESVHYHLLDHLGSRQVVTDSSGAVLTTGDGGDIEYGTFGEYNEGDGLVEEYSYTGKKYDEQVELTYFNARYYDPVIGRFITVDPVKDGVNWYVYCRNNPLKYVDPNGLISIWGGIKLEIPNFVYFYNVAKNLCDLMSGKLDPIYIFFSPLSDPNMTDGHSSTTWFDKVSGCASFSFAGGFYLDEKGFGLYTTHELAAIGFPNLGIGLELGVSGFNADTPLSDASIDAGFNIPTPFLGKAGIGVDGLFDTTNGLIGGELEANWSAWNFANNFDFDFSLAIGKIFPLLTWGSGGIPQQSYPDYSNSGTNCPYQI